MTHVIRSPYLSGIAGFLFLYTAGSTILYAAQTEIMGQAFADRALRTEVPARMELGTQLITSVGQAFLTARIIGSAGLSVTLSAVPVVSMLGFVALGLASAGVLPLVLTFIAFNVARRACEFILTNPSRKILFTVISREDKYKASSFLETFVYRAGDQVAIWGFAGLAGLGLTLAGISWIAVPLAGVFTALGVWLGKRQGELARERGGRS
jgi:AAA family ATP:ADP antiporter